MNENVRKAVFVAAALLSSAPARSSSWPAYRRDPARTGYAAEEAAPPLTQRWTYDIPGQVLSSPAVAYGRVYIGARTSKIYCFDAYTGALLWSFAATDWVDATPVVADGRVLFSSRDGNLYAVDAIAGTLMWKYSTGSKDVASPVVLAGEVYAATGSPNQTLMVLDEASGSLHRTATMPAFATASPVVDKNSGSVFVASANGQYGAWNLNLSRQWVPIQTRGSSSYATPALVNGKLIAAPGDDDWSVHAYDATTGYQVWVSTFLSTTASQPTSVAASSTTAFVGEGYTAHNLYALDLANGNVRWALGLGTVNKLGLASSPALANDLVYIISPAGQLYAVSASTGGVRASITLNGPSVTSPAVANGWIYAATLAGRVYGFQAQNAWAISGPDPLFDAAQGVVTVTGTVSSAQLQSYRVEVGTGAEPSSWTLLNQGTQTVTNGVLGSWDTRLLADGQYTLRLTIQETSASGYQTEARSVFSVSQIKTAVLDPLSATTLSLGDGTEVSIPAGAVAAADTLSAKAVLSGYPDSGVPPDAAPSTIVRLFKVASAKHPTFLKPITLKIPYFSMAPGNEDNLRIYFYDDVSGQWKIVNTSVVNKAEKRVWASVNHFTLFRIMEFRPNGALVQENAVYSYPNPATGNVVNFKFLLGDVADVTIRIFDVSGGLVAELSKPSNPAGIASTLAWDVSGKASGVYVWRFEAKTAGGSKDSVIKKLAIIH